MKIWDAMRECVENGKKFEVKDCDGYDHHYIAYDKCDDSIGLYNKINNAFITFVECEGDFIKADYVEYDDIKYYDFKTACEISKRDEVWIKRKNDCMSDRFKVDDDNFSYAGYKIDNVMIYPEDILNDDWMVVK